MLWSNHVPAWFLEVVEDTAPSHLISQLNAGEWNIALMVTMKIDAVSYVTHTKIADNIMNTSLKDTNETFL